MNGAIAEFHRALGLEPEHTDAHYSLGLALAAKGRYEEAILEYQRVLSQRPGFAELRYSLGNALEAKGTSRAALEQYRVACQLAFNNSTICAEYKRLLQKLDQ